MSSLGEQTVKPWTPPSAVSVSVGVGPSSGARGAALGTCPGKTDPPSQAAVRSLGFLR